MDKLAAIETFVAVAETGSFTRAADRLGVPKARVSQRIGDLEQAWGVRLFQRTTRRVMLTAEGVACHERCTAWLGGLHEIETALRGDEPRVTGLVRIDLLASLARQVVAPALPALLQRHPGLRIELTASNRLSSLVEEGVDIALRGGRLTDSSLVARPLGEVRVGVFAAPAWLAQHGEPVSPAAIASGQRLGLLGGQRRRCLPWTFIRGTDTVTLDEIPALTFDDDAVALEACLAGAGLLCCPRFAVTEAIGRGKLVEVLADWDCGRWPVQWVYPSRQFVPARVRVVMDWLTGLMAAHRELWHQ